MLIAAVAAVEVVAVVAVVAAVAAVVAAVVAAILAALAPLMMLLSADRGLDMLVAVTAVSAAPQGLCWGSGFRVILG